MIIKTNHLSNRQINYVVACLILDIMKPEEFMGHLKNMRFHRLEETEFSTNVGLSWPLIVENKISLSDWCSPKWRAGFSIPQWHPDEKRSPSHHSFDDKDPLIAALKTFISSKFGSEVEIPEGLRYVE